MAAGIGYPPSPRPALRFLKWYYDANDDDGCTRFMLFHFLSDWDIIVVCVIAVWKNLRLYATLLIRRAGHAVPSSAAPHSKYHFETSTFSCAKHLVGAGGRRKERREANPATTQALAPKWCDGYASRERGKDDGAGTRQLPSPRTAIRGTRRPPQVRSIVTPTS